MGSICAPPINAIETRDVIPQFSESILSSSAFIVAAPLNAPMQSIGFALAFANFHCVSGETGSLTDNGCNGCHSFGNGLSGCNNAVMPPIPNSTDTNKKAARDTLARLFDVLLTGT